MSIGVCDRRVCVAGAGKVKHAVWRSTSTCQNRARAPVWAKRGPPLTGAPPAPTTMDVQVTSKQRRSLAPPVAGAENPTAQQQQSGAYNGGGGAEPAAPLPPLESFREIELKRAQYVGPTDESNWVIPGRARGVRDRRFRERK